MGDSMTEAAPVSWNQTFVGRLQDLWRGRAEVLNGAVVDFGPVLMLPKLEDLLGKAGELRKSTMPIPSMVGGTKFC